MIFFLTVSKLVNLLLTIVFLSTETLWSEVPRVNGTWPRQSVFATEMKKK